MCSATGTPEQEVEAHMPTESEQVALEILEQLQMSGERDRLKAWLQRELHSKGWTAAMHARAATYAERRESSPESSAAPLKASELAEELGTLGHGTLGQCQCSMAHVPSINVTLVPLTTPRHPSLYFLLILHLLISFNS